MKTNGHRSTRVIFALVLSGACLAAAAAEPPPRVRIDASDLDLRSQEGVAVLYGRIRLAARDVCRSHASVTGSRVRAEFTRCVRDAIDGAVYGWRLPMLAAMHDELGAEFVGATPPRRKTII
jgi:UrcA family protein